MLLLPLLPLLLLPLLPLPLLLLLRLLPLPLLLAACWRVTRGVGGRPTTTQT
jgi:hypothetical protein